jgi:hypothetical protein
MNCLSDGATRDTSNIRPLEKLHRTFESRSGRVYRRTPVFTTTFTVYLLADHRVTNDNLLEFLCEISGSNNGEYVLTASETSVNFYQTTRRNIPEDSHILLKLLCYWLSASDGPTQYPITRFIILLNCYFINSLKSKLV